MIFFSRFIKSMEDRYAEQRSDFTARLVEKDFQIRNLRVELAEARRKVERMEAVLMPLSSTTGAIYSQRFPPKKEEVKMAEAPLDWQGELNRMLKEEEDGIRSGRRVPVNEPGTDDGSQT